MHDVNNYTFWNVYIKDDVYSNWKKKSSDDNKKTSIICIRPLI